MMAPIWQCSDWSLRSDNDGAIVSDRQPQPDGSLKCTQGYAVEKLLYPHGESPSAQGMPKIELTAEVYGRLLYQISGLYGPALEKWNTRARARAHLRPDFLDSLRQGPPSITQMMRLPPPPPANLRELIAGLSSLQARSGPPSGKLYALPKDRKLLVLQRAKEQALQRTG